MASTGKRARSQEGNPGVTIAEVGRRAGVSIATVSRVFHDAPGVGEATRRRVRRVIRDLDYRPNALARSLHQHRSHTIGLIVPDISNPYYAEITHGIEAVARRSGYALFICNTDRDPATMAHQVRLCREHRVDGVIVAGGATANRQHLTGLAASGLAAVLIGRHGVDLPTVRIDNEAGARLAAEHLLRAGHRRIAVIGGPAPSTTTADRLAGYRKALRARGLSLPEVFVKEGDLRPASGRQAAAALLRLRPRPTAILAANDQMAIGAIAAAHALGLRVPGDVSVVGFDDLELASYITPPLTTVSLPLARMGETAMELLLRGMAGPRREEQATFVPRLVVRASSGPPPREGPGRDDGGTP